MKNFRPGYLTGFQGLVPKSKRYNHRQRRAYSGLGAFGKGAFIPIPNAPPGGVPMEDAVHASTGQVYMQDPRCPEGEKMVTVMEPCKCGPTWPQDPNGCPECCGPDGCDPEGTVYPEDECDDDPDYQPKPQPELSPSAAAASDVSALPPDAVMDDAAAQAELERLEQEAAAADAIVTQAPISSASTYSPSAPSYAPPPARRQAGEPSKQERIAQLVEQYQTNRPTPRPVVRQAAPARAPAVQSMPAVPDLLGWLRNTLFGPSDGMEGWSDSRWKYLVPILVIVAVICYTKK